MFHEKSQSGYGRLEPAVRPDHFRPALQRSGQELAIEPTLNFLQDRAPEKAQGSRPGAGKMTLQANEPTLVVTKHARQGQGDFRSLARS